METGKTECNTTGSLQAASGTFLVATGIIGAAAAVELAAPGFFVLGLAAGAVGAGLHVKDAWERISAKNAKGVQQVPADERINVQE